MLMDFVLFKNAGTLGRGVFLFAALVLVDQLSKFYAVRVFPNAAFAFSLPVPPWLIYVIYFFLLSAMITYCAKHYPRFDKAQALGWTLIFAGAFSNIGERLALGFVRDWIYILSGVFNLADGYIIAGIILLLTNRAGAQANTADKQV